MAARKKILIICPHPVGYAPGQRLKYEQYFSIFENAGYDVTVSNFMSVPFQKIVYRKGRILQKIFWTITGYLRRVADIFRLWRYDVVYVFLWVTPFGPPVFERIFRAFSRKLVYDIDDMIYLQDQTSKANRFISKIKGNQKPIYMFRKSDTVVTSTETIENFAKKLNNRVYNIPVSMDTTRYRPREGYSVNGRQLIIGWSGSVTTSPYLHLLDKVLLELSKKISFRLLVMGDGNFSIPGIDVEAIPWSEEYEVETLRKFDIGLYPLPSNTWVLGKGGGKALQYMAVGVPTVATAIGINYQIIQDGENGFLVRNDDEWIDKIMMLAKDEALRKMIGENGIRTVERKYSVNANAGTYLEILETV